MQSADLQSQLVVISISTDVIRPFSSLFKISQNKANKSGEFKMTHQAAANNDHLFGRGLVGQFQMLVVITTGETAGLVKSII